MTYRILSVSYDAALLRTREMMLQGRGYDVTSAEGFTAAVEECRNGRFDLVVMGHSIPHKDKQAIIAVLNQFCDAPVLALIRAGEPPLEEAAESFDPYDPQRLMNAVERILSQRNKTAAD